MLIASCGDANNSVNHYPNGIISLSTTLSELGYFGNDMETKTGSMKS